MSGSPFNTRSSGYRDDQVLTTQGATEDELDVAELSDFTHGHSWSIVGPGPLPAPLRLATAPHDRARTLDKSYAAGPMTVRPGGKLLGEYLVLEPLALEGTTRFESWHLKSRGRAAWD